MVVIDVWMVCRTLGMRSVLSACGDGVGGWVGGDWNGMAGTWVGVVVRRDWLEFDLDWGIGDGGDDDDDDDALIGKREMSRDKERGR